MSNPITSFIISSMEPAADRESKMKDRVAETSIYAQKLVDERHGARHPFQFWKTERRSRDFDHFFVAHSTLKASEGGYNSSMKSVRYYQDKVDARKAELLAKYGK